MNRGFIFRNRKFVSAGKYVRRLNLMISYGTTYDCEKIKKFYGNRVLISCLDQDFKKSKKFYEVDSVADDCWKTNDDVCVFKFFDEKICHCHLPMGNNQVQSIII